MAEPQEVLPPPPSLPDWELFTFEGKDYGCYEPTGLEAVEKLRIFADHCTELRDKLTLGVSGLQNALQLQQEDHSKLDAKYMASMTLTGKYKAALDSCLEAVPEVPEHSYFEFSHLIFWVSVAGASMGAGYFLAKVTE